MDTSRYSVCVYQMKLNYYNVFIAVEFFDFFFRIKISYSGLFVYTYTLFYRVLDFDHQKRNEKQTNNKLSSVKCKTMPRNNFAATTETTTKIQDI